MIIRCVLLVVVVLFNTSAYSESLWDKTKAATEAAGEAIGDAAEKTKETIKGNEKTKGEARGEIDAMARNTLNKLFKQAKGAREEYNKSAGYAVFDSRRMSFMITTEFGAGVAVNKSNDQRVYMKMATGGVNIGYGAQFLQFIFLFPNQNAYKDFVNNGWDAKADADLVAGEAAGGLGITLRNGTRVYELNEQGLAMTAALTGTRYWKDDKLN